MNPIEHFLPWLNDKEKGIARRRMSDTKGIGQAAVILVSAWVAKESGDWSWFGWGLFVVAVFV